MQTLVVPLDTGDGNESQRFSQITVDPHKSVDQYPIHI